MSQLSAGTVDISAQDSSNTNIYTIFFKSHLERGDGGAGPLLVSPLPDGVHRNQVDVGAERSRDPGELFRVLRRVVDTADQRVLEGDAPPRRLEIGAAGLLDLLDAVLLRDRHDRPALLVVRRVQGDRERDREVLLREVIDARHDAAGRDSDVPPGQVQSILVRDQPDEPQQRVIIIERLARPHDDDMRDSLPREDGDPVDLVQDLGRHQAALQPVQRRRAEPAAHPAPDLRGDAHRIAVGVAHEDALHRLPIGKFKKKFLRAVLGDLPLQHLERRERMLLCKPLPERRRQVLHLVIRRCAPLVDPAEDLLRAKRLFAHLLKQALQFFRRGGFDVPHSVPRLSFAVIRPAL